MHLQDLIFPRKCPVCGKLIPLQRAFCACSSASPRRVQQDARLIAPDDPVQLRHLTAPYYYDGVIRAELLALKFHGQTRFVKPLSKAMCHAVSRSFYGVSFDCVTFVPMTKADIRSRAFNQSALLAQSIAETFSIECSALLQKTKTTQQQHTLNLAKRLTNLDGAFTATDRLRPGACVLLVDDIKTTGTTLQRCCDALLAAGARDVYCVCAAVAQQLSPANEAASPA